MRTHRPKLGLAFAVTLAASIATSHADTLALRDGGLLEGRYAGGTGDVVQFIIGDQSRYFPVAVIGQLVLSPRENGAGTAADRGGAPSLPAAIEAEKTVTLRLRDGSVFKGAYRGGTGEQVYFQVFDDVRSFAIGKVVTIEFIPPPAGPPPGAPSPSAAVASSKAGGAGQGPKKVFFGGGFGFGYGDISWIEVWPVLGYRVSPKLTAGVEFLYRARDDDRYAKDIDATDYGISPFVRLNLMRGLFVQAEYEYLSYEYVDAGLLSTERDDYDSVLLGVGLSRPMGGHAAFVISAFYNFSYSDDDLYSPYDEAWIINAGVGFGF